MDAAVARRQKFKPSVSGAAGQRRRNLAVTLGKGRREAVVQAKRIRRDADGDVPMDFVEDEAALVEDTKAAVEELKSALRDISKGSSQRRLTALNKLRRLLSSSLAPPVEAAVQAEAVPVLVECLRFGSPEEQLLDAAWCLTNIAAGNVEQTRSILCAVPLLIAHLGEKSLLSVAEQCAWALGNVSGESEDLRDVLLAQGVLRPLARLISSNSAPLARTACWALSNLIKGPSPKAVSELTKLEGILEAVLRHLQTGDDNLRAEASWILVYLSSLSDSHSLIRAGLLPSLVRCLATSSEVALLTPVLRTIGNVVAGDDSQTDAVISSGDGIPGGVLGALVRCLEHENRSLQKEAAWVLSNIAAGSLEHKRLVFSAAAPALLHKLQAGSFDVRREAAYALGNMCLKIGPNLGAEPIMEHLTALLSGVCVPGFVNLVKSPDLESSKLSLKFLEVVMRTIPGGPQLVEKCEGMEAVEMLQFHENEELRSMANYIMDTYFGDEYGLEDEYGTNSVQALRADQSDEYPPWRRVGNSSVS